MDPRALSEAPGFDSGGCCRLTGHCPSDLVQNLERTYGIECRCRSPIGSVLLRRLVHSTGTALRTVDFPGNDDSQRPGWDGWVETNVGTPWIPEGKSGWEFGTTKEIGQKANDDFQKSLKQHSETERQTIVFVFVTPRRWTGKNAWLKEKKALNEWRDH